MHLMRLALTEMLVMHDDRHAEQSERVQHDHAQRFRAANEAYGILGDGELCCSWRSSANVHHGGPSCYLKPAVRYLIESTGSRLHPIRCEEGGVQSLWTHSSWTREGVWAAVISGQQQRRLQCPLQLHTAGHWSLLRSPPQTRQGCSSTAC